MAEITLDHITKRYPDGYEAVSRHEPRDRRRRVRDPRRPVRLREVHRPADDRRPGGHHRRRAADRRRGGERQGAQGPRHRDGVPELRALSAHERARQHGVRAQAAQDGPERDRREGERGRADPRPRAAPGPQARAALRRPAPARGHGPRDRARSRRVPDGRAAVEPGRQAARADAHRGLADPGPAGHHHRLRDARPDRGADARRPCGGHACGAHPAGGVADGPLQPPAEPVRGRVHRLAGHELHARRDRGRLGEAAARERAAAAGGARAPGPGRGTQPDRGHPPGELRGRAPRWATPATAAPPSGPRSTCWSRWARSSTPTSGWSRTRASSPRSCASWPRTPAAARCRWPARRAASWPGSTRPARSSRARTPSYGWTRIACSSSTRRTDATCWWPTRPRPPAATA